MGFYTELLFNEIELPGRSLRPLRESAMKALLERGCRWSYMLDYIYLESSNYCTIDLQISKAMKEELTKLHGQPPVPWDELGEAESLVDSEEEADDPCYRVAWYPHDGFSGKWYDVESFVAWICAFCTGGQLFQLTQEEGGGLWGWEFKEGMFRELELRPKGRWRKFPSSKTA